MERDGVQDSAAPQEIDPATGLPTGRRLKRMIPVNTTAPETNFVPWKNKRTGEVSMVPEGIDPGWEYNPGMKRRENLEKMLQGKLDAADPELQRIARADLESRKQ